VADIAAMFPKRCANAIDMKLLGKAGLIVAGYVAAFLIASATVAAWVVVTGRATQGSDGMMAFGEIVLFLAVFGIAAVPPTGGMLFLLRPYSVVWRALSIVALCVAATGVAAVVIFAAGRATADSALALWAAFAILRILFSPLFAGADLLCALFAPNRGARIALLIAAAMETTVIGYGALIWVRALLLG
jgi:hypothetical protein